MVEFIILIKAKKINQMEGLNIYGAFVNSPYAFSNYNPCYPYYQYWNQQSFEGFNFAYSQFSSPFYPEVELCDLTHHTQGSSESQSAVASEQGQVSEEKTVDRETRSKAIKNSYGSKKSEKIVSKAQGEQKENRNVYSNILRNFFRKINDISKIDKLVRLIIQKRHLSLTAEEFFDYIRKLKVNHGKYLRFKKLRHIFIDETMQEHSMVFRILFEHFKNGELLVQTLTSRKIGKWSVVLHLKGVRDLEERLFQ